MNEIILKEIESLQKSREKLYDDVHKIDPSSVNYYNLENSIKARIDEINIRIDNLKLEYQSNTMNNESKSDQ